MVNTLKKQKTDKKTRWSHKSEAEVITRRRACALLALKISIYRQEILVHL